MSKAGSTDLDHFIAGLPKAELHLHIEGSLEPEQMFAFAQRNGVRLPYGSVEDIREAYRFKDLQAFLDLYYAGTAVLVTRQDFFDLTMAYARRVAADNCRHSEIFFDPQAHTERGIAFDVVIEGILAAMAEAEKQLGLSMSLILSFLRHLPEETALVTLEAAKPYRDHLIGVGLDSSELGHPPENFVRVFAAAREAGFKLMAHAGEEGPPAYVWGALDNLHVDRIDHGNRALEDPALVERLARDGMTLTVCPLSNLKLCVVDQMQDHPIKRMLDLDLRATVNSDDPAYFGGYLNDNFTAIAQALSLSKADLLLLAENSFRGAFLPDAKRTALLAELSAYGARWDL
ncbi:MAG: adenosine deaminase [Rhodospirillaceae bacterium]